MNINNVYCCDWYPLYQKEANDNQYQNYLKERNFYLDIWGNTRPEENGIQHPKGMILLEIDLDSMESVQ